MNYYSDNIGNIFRKLKGAFLVYLGNTKKDRKNNEHLILDYKNIQDALRTAYSKNYNNEFDYEPAIERLKKFLEKRDIFFKNTVDDNEKTEILKYFIEAIREIEKISIKEIKGKVKK